MYLLQSEMDTDLAKSPQHVFLASDEATAPECVALNRRC